MTEKTMSEGRLEEIRAAAGYEFNPGTIALSAAWELIHEVDRLRSVAARQERMEAALQKIDRAAVNIERVLSLARDDPETVAAVTSVNAADIRSFARAALTPEARQ